MSEVPSNWVSEKLGKRVKLVGGYAFKSNDFASFGIPLVKISTIQNGYVDINNTNHISQDTQVKNEFKVENGDVLIAMSGATTGKIGKYVSERMSYLNQRVGNFKIKKDLEQDFLLYLVSTTSFMESVLIDAVGGAQPNISGPQIESIECVFPTVTEQKKIAEILTSVDKVIELTETEIEKLKNLKKGMMQDLLTKGIGHTKFKESPIGKIPKSWEVKKLDEITSKDRIITYGIVQAGPHVEGGIPYVRVSDMSGSTLNPNTMLKTSQEIASKFERSSLKRGDLVYALRGLIGKVLKVPKSLEGGNLTQGTARIALNDESLIDYIHWAMASSYVERQNDLEAKGSTFKEVTLASLRKIKVAIPIDESERNQIVESLESVHNNILSTESKLEILKNLKKGLMQDLLTGKVRV